MGLTEAHFREILRRQSPPGFGKNYEPSIRATREEAPSRSRPAWVWSNKLLRDISTLSAPERAVLPIILKCPYFFELHEQRMLPYLPAPHPLHGHPYAAGMVLPSMRGTLAVASDLGILKYHPVISIKSKSGAQVEEIPACWFGDFLVFLKKPEETPRCVNISVKQTREEFSQPQVGVTIRTNKERAALQAAARHQVENTLYEEVEIPTIFVAADELNPILVANLQDLILWQKRIAPFSLPQQEDIVGKFNDGMKAGKSALEVIHDVSTRSGYKPYDIKIVLYQSIWDGKIRIDLLRYFFIDHPLVPEEKSVMDLYGHWFEQGNP